LGIPGSTGQLFGVWKGMTIAAFSYFGVEIVAVTASEAKYPRTDLPGAARRVCLLTIGLYVSCVFFVSLNVPYTNEKLPSLSHQTAAENSPFVIAIRSAGIDVLPGFISGAMLFSSWSTCLTSLFVASRVPFSFPE
jgi:amino acid transporter